MTAKELLAITPGSYKEVPYKRYISVLQNVLIDKPEESDLTDEEFQYIQAISTLSLLIDIPISQLEQYPFKDIQPLFNKLKFLDEEIKPEKVTHLKVKSMEKLTYKEFQSLLLLVPDQWNNMDSILEIMIEGLSDQERDNLSATDMFSVFFFVQRQSIKSIKRKMRSLVFQVMKQKVVQKIRKVFLRD